MSVAEKVRILESVWQSPCAHPGDVTSPAWIGPGRKRTSTQPGAGDLFQASPDDLPTIESTRCEVVAKSRSMPGCGESPRRA